MSEADKFVQVVDDEAGMRTSPALFEFTPISRAHSQKVKL
jgi:hypothetical protein